MCCEHLAAGLYYIAHAGPTRMAFCLHYVSFGVVYYLSGTGPTVYSVSACSGCLYCRKQDYMSITISVHDRMSAVRDFDSASVIF